GQGRCRLRLRLLAGARPAAHRRGGPGLADGVGRQKQPAQGRRPVEGDPRQRPRLREERLRLPAGRPAPRDIDDALYREVRVMGWNVEFEVPANGRLHKATVTARGDDNAVLFREKVDMDSSRERRRLAKALAEKFNEDRANIESKVEQAWNAKVGERLKE